jgi:hypothetical protein
LGTGAGHEQQSGTFEVIIRVSVVDLTVLDTSCHKSCRSQLQTLKSKRG